VVGIFDRNIGDGHNFNVTVGLMTPCSFNSSLKRPHRIWGPRSLLINGYRALSLEGMWPAREARCSPPSSAEVNLGGGVPFLALMSWRVRQRVYLMRSQFPVTKSEPQSIAVLFRAALVLFLKPVQVSWNV